MKKHFLFLAILVTNFYFSQIVIGNLISNEDNIPIKFAKIGFENIEKGTFSDEKGNFSIDLTNIDKNSTIKIEVAGFETYKNSVSKFIQTSPIIIALNPKTISIQEVVVSGKKYISKNLGFNSKSKNIHLDYLSKDSQTAINKYSKEELEKPQAEVAVPIRSKSKTKINKININFAKFDVSKPIPAKFIIYSEQDGKPDKILNSEDILFYISNENIINNVFTLDVSDKNIWFNDKIFISFQPLDRNFKGSFWISAGFLGNSYFRSFVENWRKLPASLVPSINIDVKTEK